MVKYHSARSNLCIGCVKENKSAVKVRPKGKVKPLLCLANNKILASGMDTLNVYPEDKYTKMYNLAR